MALRAIELGAFKIWVFCPVFIKDEEHRTLHGVERDELKHFAVMHLADVNIVIEIESARLFGQIFSY
jgi:hypothetical protein